VSSPQHPPVEMQPLSILLADDDIATRTLLTRFLEQQGHRVVAVGNGRDAIRTYQRNPEFQLFVLDVTMPFVSGLEVCQWLKENMAYWVPIMIVSANNKENDQVQGLGIGADYYITKPISFPLLAARIEACQRIAALYGDLQRKNEMLETYYSRNQADNDLARELLQRIAQTGEDQVVDAQYVVNPAGDFSGDMIVSMRSLSQRHYCFVADATGHGLPAAITLMPAVETFYRMSRQGYALGTLAAELNSRLQESLPRGRFLAATLVMVEPHTHRVEIWNGGSPPAYLLAPDERRVHQRFPARHPPLGMLPREDFDSRTESTTFQAQHAVVACTDGIVEAEAPDGRMFGARRFEDLLVCPDRPEDLALAVKETLHAFTEGRQAQDDQTLLVLPLEKLSLADMALDEAYCEVVDTSDDSRSSPLNGGWYFSLGVRGAALRNAELAPLVNKILSEIGLAGQASDRAHVCLTELINNAIDHGVLQLDSALKTRPDGFEAFFRERQRRLQQLSDGGIFIRGTFDHQDGRTLLRMAVSDSGEGFLEPDDTGDAGPSGRGVKLARRLSDTLRFHDDGATAEFEIVVDVPATTA